MKQRRVVRWMWEGEACCCGRKISIVCSGNEQAWRCLRDERRYMNLGRGLNLLAPTLRHPSGSLGNADLVALECMTSSGVDVDITEIRQLYLRTYHVGIHGITFFGSFDLFIRLDEATFPQLSFDLPHRQRFHPKMKTFCSDPACTMIHKEQRQVILFRCISST